MKHKSNEEQRKSEPCTYQAVVHQASAFLAAAGRDEEIAEYLLLDQQHWNLTEWITHQRQVMPPIEREHYETMIARIVDEMLPYQYVTGRAWFYRYSFQVNEATLIPRSETEELVRAVLEQIDTGTIPKTARVLDIGTGSGAIAITLKKECPTLSVVATDISSKALDVAKQNAERLVDGAIDFRCGDLFAPVSKDVFDVIVTNPPYIALDEREYMGVDVLKHEPKQALFADEEGYAIYWRLLQEMSEHLKPTGWSFAECGFRQGKTIQSRFQQSFPKRSVELIKDYAGIERIVVMSAESQTDEVEE
ncbi:MAG: peptide chain release factor N(5)-glutamine methyltransferase [Aerococcus sp.]|nr:peptide chain release factor N(5)-glutamine methyltransferase [Aerococcus sp.]